MILVMRVIDDGCWGCTIVLIITMLLQLWLSDLDMLAAVFAALIHDYEHTGTTNTFHINTRSVTKPCTLKRI